MRQFFLLFGPASVGVKDFEKTDLPDARSDLWQGIDKPRKCQRFCPRPYLYSRLSVCGSELDTASLLLHRQRTNMEIVERGLKIGRNASGDQK